jgi:hypothetical protein
MTSFFLSHNIVTNYTIYDHRYGNKREVCMDAHVALQSAVL